MIPHAEEIIVARRQFIDEAEFQRLAAEPGVAVGDLGHFEPRAVLAHELLEGFVRGVELAAEVFAPRRRDLAEDRDAALELARGHLLEIDVVLLQQAIEVGHLRDDADAAENRKRRGDDPVGGAGHEIPAARRDLIDAGRQLYRGGAQPQQLRGGEAVAGDGSTRALDAHDDFVLIRSRHRQHSVDLPPQPPNRAGADVALEAQDIDAFGRRRLCGALGCLLARLGKRLALLGERFALLFRQDSRIEPRLSGVIALIERVDLDLGIIFGLAPRQTRDQKHGPADRRDDEQGFQRESGDV